MNEYSMTLEDAIALRARIDEMKADIERVQGPEGPKTPTGRVTKAGNTLITAYRQAIQHAQTRLLNAPPARQTFERAVERLTSEATLDGGPGRGREKALA